jgi:hypothetical protein
LADGNAKVLNKVVRVDVLGILVTILEGLDKADQRLDHLASRLELRNLGTDQGAEGGVDKGGNLLGGLEPGPDGNLLPLSGGGLSKRQDGNSSNSNLSILSGVINEEQQDVLDVDRLQTGNPLEVIDSHGADQGLILLVRDDLGQRLDRLDVAKFAQSGDDIELDVVVLLRLQLLLQEGNPLLDNDIRIPKKVNLMLFL